ncbi:MAG: hypothetical protein ACK55Z_37150, partial [bacterium]
YWQHCLITSVINTGEQFLSGVVDTSNKFYAFRLFMTGINDAGEMLSPVSTTLLNNLSLLSMTLMSNLSPVSATPAIIVHCGLRLWGFFVHQ